jgi:hypothetical protein
MKNHEEVCKKNKTSLVTVTIIITFHTFFHAYTSLVRKCEKEMPSYKCRKLKNAVASRTLFSLSAVKGI